MANDGQFPIEITGDASSLVAESKSAGGALERIQKQIAQADKECAESVKVVSQEEVKAALASTEGAKEAFVSKKQLKDGIKGLQEQFPMLAQVASLAMNKVGFVVAGVGLAWAIWTERVKELTATLAGVQLPELSEQKVGQVQAMAKAYEDFAEAIEKAVKAYGSVDAAAKRDGERIDKEAERNKKLMESHKNLALSELEANKAKLKPGEYEKAKSEIEDFYESVGVKDDEATKQKKLARKAQQEDELARSAQAKLDEAAGIKVGTAEQDAGLDVDYEAQAKAAKEAKKGSQERLKELLAARSGEMGIGENVAYTAKYAMRYGYTMPGSEAVALEQKNIGDADVIINRYNARQKAKPGRERARGRRGELVGEAGREAGEAETIHREMWDAGGELDQFDADTKNSGKVAQNNALARANKAVGDVNNQSKQLTEQLVQAAESGTKVSAVQFKRVEEVNAALKAAVERIQSLENSRKMNPPGT